MSDQRFSFERPRDRFALVLALVLVVLAAEAAVVFWPAWWPFAGAPDEIVAKLEAPRPPLRLSEPTFPPLQRTGNGLCGATAGNGPGKCVSTGAR